MRRHAGAVIVALLLLTACTSAIPGQGRVDGPPAEPAPESCPDVPVQPPEDRPVIDLDFELAEDGRSVAGSERVRFTPDLATGELVFRLTANQPFSVAAGSGIDVGEVAGDDVATVDFEPAGADESTQGGLLVIGLRTALQPGQSTEVTIDFRLQLGAGTFDRFGQDAQTSWWGSGHPLLAWEPGVGWRREPLVDTLGETASSPVAQTTLRVLAPAGRTVLMTGGAAEVGEDGAATVWESSSIAARDVSVAVGEFTTAERSVGGTRLIVGSPEGNPAELLDRAGVALTTLEQYFGEYPFDTLSIARLADYGGGIEYPAMILLADGGEVTLTHEIAHMWFYGMVGNDQGRDPWLDESFATYAEGLVTGRSEEPGALLEDVEVGLPIGAYASSAAYFEAVYGGGSAMLALARARAGSELFDAALRCYVNANAWQTAVPADVEAALQHLPAAVAVLREAGAL